jgi:putative tryptophan/tyrosine transport system substrate-binding protein
MKTTRLHRLVLLAAFLLISGAACTPSARRMVTVGLLKPTSFFDNYMNAFKARMTELGYTEGVNIRYVDAGTPGTGDKLKDAARSLLSPDVDLIVVISTPAVAAMKEAAANTNKQIIFMNIFDPVGSGFVGNMSRPGGNLTGMRSGGAETKRLEWFVRVAPQIKKLFAPYTPGDGSSKLARDLGVKNAQMLGVEFIFQEVKSPAEVINAATNIPAEADAIYILPDGQVAAQIDHFITASLKRKLPMSAFNADSVPNGTLISYNFDPIQSGRQAARMADQFLKGVKAGDLPVETTEFFLSINFATAERLGLKISDKVLSQSDQIFYSIPDKYLGITTF